MLSQRRKFILVLAHCWTVSVAIYTGQPYKGKPSDVWALGVVLYTMIYGQFPFYDQIPQELFRKIKLVQYDLPKWGFIIIIARIQYVMWTYVKSKNFCVISTLYLIGVMYAYVFSDSRISPKTREILKRLLTLEPSSRLTASQLHHQIQDLVSQWWDVPILYYFLYFPTL